MLLLIVKTQLDAEYWFLKSDIPIWSLINFIVCTICSVLVYSLINCEALLASTELKLNCCYVTLNCSCEEMMTRNFLNNTYWKNQILILLPKNLHLVNLALSDLDQMLNDIVNLQSDIKQDRMATNRHSTMSLNDDLQELQATTTQLIKDQLEGFQNKLDAKELAQVQLSFSH